MIAKSLIKHAGKFFRDTNGQPLGNFEVETWQVKRWRYSKPVVTHAATCLAAPTSSPLVFAGDAFGGVRIEGAVLSGFAAAREVSNRIVRPTLAGDAAI